MKAVVCHDYGGLETARLEEVPPPALTADGVHIRVHACAASFASLLVMRGEHQNRVPPPFIPGTELTGEVIATGPQVHGIRTGDRVIAGVRNGAYAEEVVAPHSSVFPLPAAIGFVDGAHFPTIYGTAYAALCWRARIQPEEWVLVHGAAGGSGLAAVQLARALGARVIATASTATKRALCLEHGADHALDGSAADWPEQVRTITAGRGADIVFDPIGGQTFEQSLRCTAPDGRVLVIGFASGTIPTVAANYLLVKNIAVIGVYWGYYVGWGRIPPTPDTPARLQAAFATLFEWMREGRIRPHTHAALPLARFHEALQLVARREVLGRVILLPQAESGKSKDLPLPVA